MDPEIKIGYGYYQRRVKTFEDHLISAHNRDLQEKLSLASALTHRSVNLIPKLAESVATFVAA